MHLPLLHISDREHWDPLQLGQIEGQDFIPWLADPDSAISRASLRSPALDVASLAMAAIGSELTYFALLAGMFSAYDRHTALSLAGVVVPSVAVNQLVKAHFKFPRPPVEARHPLAFIAPGDYTFPSGHAQNAVVLGTFLALRGRRNWIRCVGISLATCVPLSRIYLGVHYPRDVIAGALLGLGTVAGVLTYERTFREWWFKQPRGPRGFTLALASCVLGLLTGTPLAAFPLGVGGGMALGHDLSGKQRFKLDQPSKNARIAQGAIGVVVFLGAGAAVRPLLKKESTMSASLAGGLVGVALTFGVPLATNIAKRFHYMRKRKKKRQQHLPKLSLGEKKVSK